MTNWSEEGWKRILEAGNRGRETRRKKLSEKYYKDPKYCKQCNKLISYDKKQNNFCDRSCSATYNNLRKIKKNGKYCEQCGNFYTSSRETSKYCTRECSFESMKEKTFLKIEETNGIGCHHKTIKKYLIFKYGHKCMICNHEKWMEQDIPLILDHIDGNSDNNCLSNMRIICGNCDMLLPTYKGKNKGNGRHYRRERYKNNQSY